MTISLYLNQIIHLTFEEEYQLAEYLSSKSKHTQMLFNHFISRFLTAGELTVQPTKSMIGISNANKRIAWVTQLGKNFVHVAFPFKQAYPGAGAAAI